MQRPYRERLHTADLVALFLLVTCPLVGHAVKINECGDRLKEAQAAAWNATHPSVPLPPLQLTNEQCLVECGGGLGDISWGVFSQSVTTWFIPWFVLSFQIPFGAEGEPFICTISLPSKILNMGRHGHRSTRRRSCLLSHHRITCACRILTANHST